MKITLVQSPIIWENISENLKLYGKILDTVKSSDLIILPEMFATGFTMNPSLFAQNAQGSIMQFLQEKASQSQAALATTLAFEETGNYYNRFIFMLPEGTYEYYDKRHLFRPGGEAKHYTQGKERKIVSYKNFRIMLQTCYDLRFPVWSRNNDNYDMLLYTANWPAVRTEAWRILLQARAIENQAFVIGVNRTGKDGNGIDHRGDSMVIDPTGKILADLKDKPENIYTTEINTDAVNALRNKFPTALDADSFIIQA